MRNDNIVKMFWQDIEIQFLNFKDKEYKNVVRDE